jgi:hypothetical protein
MGVLYRMNAIMDALKKAIECNQSLLIGRFGTIEFEVCWDYEMCAEIADKAAAVLERNAGVFPASYESQQKWAKATKAAFQNSDLLAIGWYQPIIKREAYLLEQWRCEYKKIALRDLEPYYRGVNDRWSSLLKGQKVCIVSSFTDTGLAQMSKGEERIWPGAKGSIWPEAEWSWVKTGYAPVTALGQGGWVGIDSWEEAVAQVVESVVATDAKIVLIGCGGLGMCIASALKDKGKICIVMGGAIQVFLGIRGGRWKTHDYISKLWNQEWVYPSSTETPGAARMVEQACYW